MTPAAAWMNGEFIDYQTMAVPVWDLGVVAGASMTEMARTYQHRPCRLELHVDRLVSSCEQLKFDLPYSGRELLTAANELVVRNSASLLAESDLGVVIFATAGANPTYLGDQPLPAATVGIHTFELPFHLWKNSATHGTRLVTTPIRQHDQQNLPVHLKIRNRLHWWLADQQAQEIQPGSKALLLDSEDRITETSTSAFYAVIDDTIVTPRANVLESLSRQMVSEAAAAAGFAFQCRDLRIDDLRAASECFGSSTPVGILPIASVNVQQFPVAAATSVIPQLLDYWQAQTGVNPREQLLHSRSADR
ncbi:MAG: aminotransferase class IV [Fuerstiella sp.]